MPIERITVGSYEQWGKLVKTWATGKDYVKNGHDYLKRPTSIDELKQQCALAGVDAVIPDHYKDLYYAEADVDTVLIRLPNPTLIAESEAMLETPGSEYPIPRFYRAIFQNAGAVVPDKLKLHAERIGDYSMSNCA
jgi:hypothetical protein